VRSDPGDTVSVCLLDNSTHLGWFPKLRFDEYYELLDEGTWEGDKVLIIDRVFQLNGHYLELIK